MNFTGLDPETLIRIHTLAGEKVWETTSNSSGIADWNGTNASGNPVASGVYIVQSNHKTFKVAVQR